MYVDLHCDTLTTGALASGGADADKLMASPEKLAKSGALAQCFAIFTENADVAVFESYVAVYKKMLEENAVLPIECRADFLTAEKTGRVGAVLTVENAGFIGDDLSYLKKLKGFGVKMLSLVWNYENSLAYPNLIFDGELPLFDKREPRGLKPLGREAVAALDSLGIIVDISHLSDGGAEEILRGRKTPIVASHSNAAAVLNVSRNLTDGLIRGIADCGGVIGVNFCRDFLGDGNSFERVAAHLNHIIKVGGGETVALGSDFDGIPVNPDIEDCTRVPELLNYLNLRGIDADTLDGLARGNFLRVFGEVCG